MLAEWVTDGNQLERWLEQVVASSGATVQTGDPIFAIGYFGGVELGDSVGVLITDIPEFRLDFGGLAFLDASMSFELRVDEHMNVLSIEQLGYSFHVSSPETRCVVRHDKHGHAPDWEPVCHTHRGPDEKRAASTEVYLDDVIAEVRTRIGWDADTSVHDR